MTPSDYAARMREKREIYEDFGRIIDQHGGDGGFAPLQDVEFRRDFNRIEAAVCSRPLKQEAQETITEQNAWCVP